MPDLDHIQRTRTFMAASLWAAGEPTAAVTDDGMLNVHPAGLNSALHMQISPERWRELNRVVESTIAVALRGGKPAQPRTSRVAVQGYCPFGCGATLTVDSFGNIKCLGSECPEPTGVTALLLDGETEHIVTLKAQGFTVKHPLRERINDDLLACDLHERITDNEAPPRKPGLYRVTHVGIDPVSASLHDDGYHWERIAE